MAISFVVEALYGVHAAGLDAAPLLQQAGIPERLLSIPQSRVAAERFSALWLAVAAALDDELFGRDSRRMKVGSFAALTYSCVAARTLHEALRRAIRLFAIILDDTRIDLQIDAQMASLRLLPTPRAAAAGRAIDPFAHETLLVLLHGLACWLVGRRMPVTRAVFAYPAPAHAAEYRVMYAPDLVFDAAETALVFEADLLAARVVQTRRSAAVFLRDAPYNIILKYKDVHSWAARVRQALRDTPPADWPGFDALAHRFEIHPSALRRALEREGSSFRVIKDALRRDLAIESLSNTSLPLPEVAAVAGFAEPSAFHRAFKQWTGVRPGEYRRRLSPTA